ncbi:MAG TPA: MoaD/ThiS family protein [Chloroflexota bacterium]|nr:MoaD/ThiS family protein [Chloroflexota bacterium]
MEVTVNLYGELRKHLAPGKKPPIGLRVPAGLAVRDVLDYLKVPLDAPVSVVVNGEHHDRAYTLSDGDVLSVFSMAAFGEPSP